MATAQVTAPSTPDTAWISERIYTPKAVDQYIKMLVYGDPGVGKTTLTATAVNCKPMNDVLVINIEGGIKSITDAEGILEKPPKVIDFTEWKELEGVFWYLAKEKHPYKTLIIDSLSELQQRNLDMVVANQMSRDSRRKDPDEVWLEDYGRNTKQMIRVIRAFRDLPMHVLLTCHAQSSQDADKNETVFPSLTNKFCKAVMGYMDVVGYMFVTQQQKEGEQVSVRKLLTRPYGKWQAKDRSPGGRLGQVIDNPTMSDIYTKITRTNNAR